MGYEEFFQISYSYFDYFIYISIFLFIILYTLTKKLSINGLIDPFTYNYTFTYATSYSVIIILYSLGYITHYTFFIFFTYGLLFVLSLKIFSITSYYPFNKKIFSFFIYKKTKIFTFSLLTLYIILMALTIYLKGFSIFTETNRYEDNRGFGPIVRILELSNLALISIISINLYQHSVLTWKKLIGYFFLLIFMLFNAMISGAKADLLFFIFSALVSIKVYDPTFKLPKKFIVIIFLLALSFAMVALYFNFSKSIDDDIPIFEIFDILFRRLTDRILSNGDMYYMGLPNDIYLNITTNNIFITTFSPVLSYSLMSSLAGYDVSQLEIGKQLLLAHYSGRTIAGGPTDHIDFFALLYFGVIGGAVFIILFSALLCFINSLVKYASYSIVPSTLITVFWMKSLSWILKPGLIIGSFVYFILFLFLLKCIITVISIRSHS
ncbi:O-antigen polymerase [Providencia vermicola]|uniref:O-antigen ligase n=1 Tax=Providencia vermicola TaxID=333965 RepID=A0AAX3RZP0_9GAMM|nr:O-antigen polymerase [Providencia vermicola]WFC07637.1 O-antigen ligase [Providencia vermicola]